MFIRNFYPADKFAAFHPEVYSVGLSWLPTPTAKSASSRAVISQHRFTLAGKIMAPVVNGFERKMRIILLDNIHTGWPNKNAPSFQAYHFAMVMDRILIIHTCIVLSILR